MADFLFLITEGVPALLAGLIPTGPGLWPKCGSSISNPQPPEANRGPKPTEKPLKMA